MIADNETWERKKASLLAYKSQPEIIPSLLNDLENMGKKEYFKKIDRPKIYYAEYSHLFSS